MPGDSTAALLASPQNWALPAQRRRFIAHIIQADGWVTIQEIVDRFGVSAATARRDLRMLAEQGVIVRVHGGAGGSSARW